MSNTQCHPYSKPPSQKRSGGKQSSAYNARNLRLKADVRRQLSADHQPVQIHQDNNGAVVQDESGVLYRIVQTSANSSEIEDSRNSKPTTAMSCLSLDIERNDSAPSENMQQGQQYHLQAVDGQQYFIVLPSNVTPVASDQSKNRTTEILLVGQQNSGTDLNSSSEFGVSRATDRRSSHNEVEKRRRDKINTWVNTLAEIVPSAAEDNVKNLQFKSNILAKTVDYIYELRANNAHWVQAMRQEITARRSTEEELRSQVEQLTHQNQALRRKLQDSGLSLPGALPWTGDDTSLDDQAQSSSAQSHSACAANGQSTKIVVNRPTVFTPCHQIPQPVPSRPTPPSATSCNARLVACGGTVFLLTAPPSSTAKQPPSPNQIKTAVISSSLTPQQLPPVTVTSEAAVTALARPAGLATSQLGLVTGTAALIEEQPFSDSSTPVAMTSPS